MWSRTTKSRHANKSARPNKPPRVRVVEMERAWDAAALWDEHDHPDMAKYLALARTFELDFGFRFSRGDGEDHHFKRMAFHASVAQELAQRFDNDMTRIAVEFSKPLTYTIRNPYPDGDPRQLKLESHFRQMKLEDEGSAAVEALPHAVNLEFPFSFRFPDVQMMGSPAGYYDAVMIKSMREESVLRL